MPEHEEEHRHGLGHGEHSETLKDPDKKKHETWMLWALGLGAAGIILTLFMLSKSSGGAAAAGQQGTSTLVEPSAPFVPNPTDTSNGQSDYWPYLMAAYYAAGQQNNTGSSSSGSSSNKKSKDKDKDKGKSAGHTGVSGTGGTTSTGGTHSGSSHSGTPAGKAHKQKTYGHSAVTHQPKAVSPKVSGA